MPKSALIIVDVQNDFCPGGSLPVSLGDEIIPVINKIRNCFDLVIASKDWHPKDHMSFASNHPGKSPGQNLELNGIKQVMWPDHCVQNTLGAEFKSGLNIKSNDLIVTKGSDPQVDSYSAFMDNDKKTMTDLDALLKKNNISQIFITGLATDYCVKYTAIDGLMLGYSVKVITDATKGVNINPDDSEEALKEMSGKGVVLVESSSLLKG